MFLRKERSTIFRDIQQRGKQPTKICSALIRCKVFKVENDQPMNSQKQERRSGVRLRMLLLKDVEGLSETSAEDKLASKWNKADSNAVIVDVDCTTDDAKDLCSKYGVQGYPTLKYFSPRTSKEGDTYEDARDLKALNKFVKRASKLPCSPDTGENCDKKDNAYIEESRFFVMFFDTV